MPEDKPEQPPFESSLVGSEIEQRGEVSEQQIRMQRLLDFALKPAESTQYLKPREAYAQLYEQARLAEIAGEKALALDLYLQALSSLEGSEINPKKDLSLEPNFALSIASAIGRVGGDLGQALDRASAIGLKLVNPKTLIRIAQQRTLRGVGDRIEQAEYIPNDEDSVKMQLPGEFVRDLTGTKYPSSKSSAYWILEAVREAFPVAVRNFSQAAVIAHRANDKNRSEQFFMQARVLAQFRNLNLREIMENEWHYDKKESFDSKSAMSLAHALKSVGKEVDAFELALQHFDMNADLRKMCDDAISLAERHINDPGVPRLIEEFLKKINEWGDSLSADYVENAKLTIAAILLRHSGQERRGEVLKGLIESLKKQLE